MPEIRIQVAHIIVVVVQAPLQSRPRGRSEPVLAAPKHQMNRWSFSMRIGCLVKIQLADQLTEGMTPDEVTNLALQVIGFRWDDGSGKWVSRSASRNGPAT